MKGPIARDIKKLSEHPLLTGMCSVLLEKGDPFQYCHLGIMYVFKIVLAMVDF